MPEVEVASQPEVTGVNSAVKLDPAVFVRVDIGAYGQNVATAMKGLPVQGWALLILRGRDVVLHMHHGAAWPNTTHEMLTTTAMSIGSVSKTVTAAAVVNAVARQVAKQDPKTPATISAFDQPVQQFLPRDFVSDNPQSPKVTLRDLLQHKAYLHDTGSFYADLKKSWQEGPALGKVPGTGNGKYSNTGYAFLRIILPYLVHGRETFDAIEEAAIAEAAVADTSYPLISDPRIDYLTSSLYLSYVRTHVLKRCGISSAEADVNPVGKYPSWHFGVVETEVSGMEFYEFYGIPETHDDAALLKAGPGNWHMSAATVGQFCVGISHGQVFPSPKGGTSNDWWYVMRDNYLGFKAGHTITHNDVTFPIYPKRGGEASGKYPQRTGIQTVILMTPQDITGVLFFNSTSPKPRTDPYTVLKAAYEAALR